MAVYDKCHELARAIKESKEYQEYKEIKNIVYNDLHLKDKIDEFEKIRYEEQLLAIQGEARESRKNAKITRAL